jgi:predicted nuclease of predicted toxin-antitoxin system
MPLKLYFDHHIHKAIAVGLRLREVDILTAYEDNAGELADPDLLDRASELGRVLFTHDDDLLVEAALRQEQERPFAGVVYVHQLQLTVGQCINELELLAKLANEGEAENQVIFLPL